MNETPQPSPAEPSPAFGTTRWTLVLRARGDAPEARAALGELCQAYWDPVYRFLRREGRGDDEARELAQEFVARLLTRGAFEGADPERGRFRSYLLGALKHFLADQRRAARRKKRGGGGGPDPIGLTGGGPGSAPPLDVPDPSASVPDAYFDHEWALAVIDRALTSVQSELEAAGRGSHFQTLKPWLAGDAEPLSLSQSDAAAQLGISAGAVKVAIHRLRARFRDAVRAEIAQTVPSPDEVAAELRYLIEALCQGRP